MCIVYRDFEIELDLEFHRVEYETWLLLTSYSYSLFEWVGKWEIFFEASVKIEDIHTDIIAVHQEYI